MLWTRWLREHLPSLTDRKEWTTNSRNLEIGDLVIFIFLIVLKNDGRERFYDVEIQT